MNIKNIYIFLNKSLLIGKELKLYIIKCHWNYILFNLKRYYSFYKILILKSQILIIICDINNNLNKWKFSKQK